MTQQERTWAAALAITFDDRAVRRHLVLRHPLDVERARVALDVLERRSRREGGDGGRPARGGSARRGRRRSCSSAG